ncbi:D-alanyl-D-alanine carboxypeptidase family protein [Adlercreutzia sp. ZJ242]|uniref:D-alanyl-D-alanine carboxypeptidase family protein n=1 Tax=Adlercreutzia sp. ZJ242 TaxID=2709409 RepID=UPI0013ED04D9|nr:D-alanyl-D-alanine carboxypeptidase family protein [Adlercreutzia sp. ZJ242]
MQLNTNLTYAAFADAHPVRRRRRDRARRLACAGLLCASMAMGPCALALADADAAWADVRRTDVIAGTAMEQRGIAAAACPSIDAERAIVVDADGKVYFERNASDPAQIASITKVMTAVVALDAAPLDTPVTVSALAAEVGESSAHLQEGDVMPLGEALKALMIPSGNDAAIAIAESVGKAVLGGSTDEKALAAFVEAMNAKAAELGCTDSVFTNPHGLDDGEWEGKLHSTAADVAKIAAYAMGNETFRSIVGTEAAAIEVERDGEKASIELESTDELLGVYEGACGIKTGFTNQAGACFAGAATRDGVELYAIVLKSSSEAQRFVDTTTLFDWVYDNRVTYALAHAAESVSVTLGGAQVDAPVVAEVAHADWPDRTVKATFADPAASVEVFALDGNVSESFEFDEPKGDVKVGDVLGRATFHQGNEVVAQVDLVACEDVAAPGVFEGIGIWWDRFIKGFTGEPTMADSVVLNDVSLIYDKQALVV